MKKSSPWLLRGLYFLIFIAVFGDFIANERPIVCKLDGAWYFPAFKQYAVNLGLADWEGKFVTTPWHDQNYDFRILPPIPYSADTQDKKNRKFVSPFAEQNIPNWRWRHWLGTDRLGRDVLAGMIAGTRTALLVGLIAMSIASFIGIIMGALAGYFGDERVRTPIVRFVLTLLGFGLGFFFAFISRSYVLQTTSNLFLEVLKSVCILIFVTLLFNGLGWLLSKLPFFSRSMRVPFDTIIMRLIEVFRSIPAILILLSLLALLKRPSVLYVMFIIGCLAWPSIARFIRAELLRIRQLEYIDAARSIGLPEWRILLRHAIPNALPPVLITIAFGIASAILLEAALSFLGIGVDVNAITWGSMLRVSKISAWWMVIFPGLAIFFTVTLFNLLGDSLSKQRV